MMTFYGKIHEVVLGSRWGKEEYHEQVEIMLSCNVGTVLSPIAAAIIFYLDKWAFIFL